MGDEPQLMRWNTRIAHKSNATSAEHVIPWSTKPVTAQICSFVAYQRFLRDWWLLGNVEFQVQYMGMIAGQNGIIAGPVLPVNVPCSIAPCQVQMI